MRTESDATEEKYKDRGTQPVGEDQPDFGLSWSKRGSSPSEVILRHPPSDTKGSRQVSVSFRSSYNKRGSSGSDMSGPASPSLRRSKVVTGDTHLTERPRVSFFCKLTLLLLCNC